MSVERSAPSMQDIEISRQFLARVRCWLDRYTPRYYDDCVRALSTLEILLDSHEEGSGDAG